MIEIEVIGTPAPQGSKVKTKWGMREDNPNTAPWRGLVAFQAAHVMRGKPALDGPLKLEVTFTFTRPASHFGTGKNAGVLKANAPTWKDGKPDYDKLCRAIGDALTDGGVIRDDARIALAIIHKIYGEQASARILVTELT